MPWQKRQSRPSWNSAVPSPGLRPGLGRNPVGPAGLRRPMVVRVHTASATSRPRLLHTIPTVCKTASGPVRRPPKVGHTRSSTRLLEAAFITAALPGSGPFLVPTPTPMPIPAVIRQAVDEVDVAYPTPKATTLRIRSAPITAIRALAVARATTEPTFLARLDVTLIRALPIRPALTTGQRPKRTPVQTALRSLGPRAKTLIAPALAAEVQLITAKTPKGPPILRRSPSNQPGKAKTLAQMEDSC